MRKAPKASRTTNIPNGDHLSRQGIKKKGRVLPAFFSSVLTSSHSILRPAK